MKCSVFICLLFCYTTLIRFCLRDAIVPSEPWPPLYLGFTITLIQRPHSVGLLWTVDQPTQRHLRYKTHRSREIFPPPPAGFELTIPRWQLTQMHTLSGTTTGIGVIRFYWTQLLVKYIMLTSACIFNKLLLDWHMKVNVFGIQGYWIILIIIIFVFRKEIDFKSHLVLSAACLQRFIEACNCGIFTFIRGIIFKLFFRVCV